MDESDDKERDWLQAELEDTLDAVVPAPDPSLLVQQEDRVVADLLDQRSINAVHRLRGGRYVPALVHAAISGLAAFRIVSPVTFGGARTAA